MVKLAAALDSPVEGPLLDGIAWRPGILHAGGFDLAVPDPKQEGSEDA